MKCVLKGGATVNPSPAEHVLSVGLLFPALVGLYWGHPHQLVKEDGAEIGESVRGWSESWPCHCLVVSQGHCLPDSDLNFLLRILGLLTPKICKSDA